MRVRDGVGSVLEVGSAVALTVGASMFAAAAGWVVGGVLGLLFAWRLTK